MSKAGTGHGITGKDIDKRVTFFIPKMRNSVKICLPGCVNVCALGTETVGMSSGLVPWAPRRAKAGSCD